MTPNPNENQAEKHSAWSFEEAQLDKIKDTPLGRHVISLRTELSTLRKELEAAKKGENLEEVAKAIKECPNCNWRSNHFCGWHGVSVRKLLFPNS